MSLFGGPRGRPSVRAAQDDVRSGPSVDHVIAVQPEDHIVARTAANDVGTVQRLVGDGARLNRPVVLPVVIGSNQRLDLCPRSTPASDTPGPGANS